MENLEYPASMSEVEVLAELYHLGQQDDIDIRLGVIAPNSSHYRLDAVVFKESEPICIIECKGDLIHELSSQNKRRLDAQLEKYKSMFGLPILVCGNSKMDIVRTIASVKKLIIV